MKRTPSFEVESILGLKSAFCKRNDGVSVDRTESLPNQVFYKSDFLVEMYNKLKKRDSAFTISMFSRKIFFS